MKTIGIEFARKEEGGRYILSAHPLSTDDTSVILALFSTENLSSEIPVGTVSQAGHDLCDAELKGTEADFAFLFHTIDSVDALVRSLGRVRELLQKTEGEQI